MDSQQEVQAQITVTVTTLYPTGSSGIRPSLKQYGGKHFILNPLNPGNFCRSEAIRSIFCSLSG